MKEKFNISTDKSKLDLNLIHSYLSKESYWAKGRGFDIVKKSIEHSLCFGAYFENQQVAFARVVTDYSVFAWILDVFVLDEYKGQGLGKKLLSEIMSHEGLQGLRRWGLTTWDAQGLYEQFGFQALEKPENHMEIVNTQHKKPNLALEG